MTNAAKASVWDAVWQPFGGAHSITGSATLNTRLPGQWFQSETGLHYNWHRSYDPTLGRYTQPDPLGFVDGPSVYGYAGGSPTNEVDEFGLSRSGPTWRGPRTRWNYNPNALYYPPPRPRPPQQCTPQNPQGRQFELDASSKLHFSTSRDGSISRDIVFNQRLPPETMREMRDILDRSITRREQENRDFGPNLREGPHTRRIEQERDILRTIDKKLGGS